MESSAAATTLGRRQPTLLRFASMDSSDSDVRPEFNCRPSGTMVFHRSAAIPRSLTPLGSVVMYILQEQLSRSVPLGRSRAPLTFTTPAQHERYTQQARNIFYKCFRSMGWVESLVGSCRNPETKHLFGGEFLREKISYAARKIVLCLRLLQTKTRPGQTMCLRCTRAPVNARGPIDDGAQSLDVHSNHVHCTAGEFTIIDSVSILPPLREFDPPMLCEMHQYVFQFYLYKVVNPSWPVPYLLEDVEIFGQIRVARWSSDSNSFEHEVEDESP